MVELLPPRSLPASFVYGENTLLQWEVPVVYRVTDPANYMLQGDPLVKLLLWDTSQPAASAPPAHGVLLTYKLDFTPSRMCTVGFHQASGNS